MTIKTIIVKVRYFEIFNNAILFTDGKFNKNPIYQDVKYFHSFEEEYLLLDNNQKVINQDEFPNIPENYGYKRFSASKTHFLLYDRNSLDLNTFTHTKEAIYSLDEKQIIYDGSIIGDRIFDNYIVGGINKNEINVFSINTKSIISSFYLTSLELILSEQFVKPYQVSEFCDIYKNILITTFTNGDILLLDIDKGEPIKLFNDTKIKEGLFQKEENSPIYIGLKFKTYIEIDVEKREIIKQLDLEEYFKEKFNRSLLVPINTTIYKNGLIYFIADTNIVGLFDPKTMEVHDFYEFEFENKQTMLKGGKENLQVKGSNIYCLDNQHNLYEMELNPAS